MIYCRSAGNAGATGMFLNAGNGIQLTKKSASITFCSLFCLYVTDTPLSPCLIETIGVLNHTLDPNRFAKVLGNIWFPPFSLKTSGGDKGTPRNFSIASYQRLKSAEELFPPRNRNAVLEAPSFL